jgi:hypothetical protein
MMLMYHRMKKCGVQARNYKNGDKMKHLLLANMIMMALCSAAYAGFLLSPGGEFTSGNQPAQSEINTALSSLGISNLLYKDNVGGSEEGAFASYYTTVYSNDPSDPKDALITWDGGDFITGGYLLVKDGNHSPAWYLFDIGSWDGKETLQLNDFWPNGGAISHVSIYDGGMNPVPEPSTMILFGAGIACLVGYARRKRK